MIAQLLSWLFAATPASAGTITDATGRTVSASPGDKMVVLSGGLTESVFALGAGDGVVGVDSTSVFPAAVERLPKTAYYRQLSAEGVLSLGPDLILLPDDAGPAAVIEQLRGSGVRVAVLPGAPSLDAARQRILSLGALLDRPAQAERAIEELERDLGNVVRPKTPKRVVFVYARGAGALQVAGNQTAADTMITLAGGVNAISDFDGYRPLTAEALVAAKPDLLLLTDRGLDAMGGIDAVLSLPGVALTPAGEQRRIASLDDLLLLGFGPRTGEAAIALAQILSGP